VSPDTKWCLLGATGTGAEGAVNGKMQLFSREKKMHQMIQGRAGSFVTLKLFGRDYPAQLLCFHGKKADSPPGEHPKLFVIEVGSDLSSEGARFRLVTRIPVPPGADDDDVPVSLVIDQKDELAFLITKMGFLSLFDTHTCS